MASIIGAKPDGIHPGIYGVAYDCELYIAKALMKNGSGNISYVVKALKWLIEEKVDIINLSLGSPVYSKQVDNAIQLAIDNDILCCVAAGNEGDGRANTKEVSYPAYLKYQLQ